jgi:hypothetical protein
MKYLFLILFSLNAFAEFKVEVKNLQGVVTHGGEFKTINDAQAWITSKINSNDWGKEERIIPKSECSPEELLLVMETYPEMLCAEDDKLCHPSPEKVKLPKMYTTSIIDITPVKDAERTKLTNKKLAMERIKAWKKENLDSATTIATLRTQLKDLFNDLVEIMKE